MADDPSPPPASPADGGRPGGRRRADDVDRAIGRRVRERRVMLGLTLQQLAEPLGIAYQQLAKYERGANRVPAGRLHQIAQALGTDVGQFFEGLEPEGGHERAEPAGVRARALMVLGLVRDVAGVGDPKVQEAVCELVRVLAALETNVSASPYVDRPRRGTPCW